VSTDTSHQRSTDLKRTYLMCAQRGVVTFVTYSPLLPSLLGHAKLGGDCVAERKHSNKVPEDILPSRTFGDPLLLGRGAGLELLNRPVTGDK